MNVNTLLPASSAGFVTNNRGPSGKFQFGQKSTIDAAVAVGTAWNALSPEHPFSIGQISLKGGGQMPPHKSHRVGLDVDVRPMRIDGANEPVTITDSKYDRATTTKLIALWWKKAPVQSLFFNDPTVIAAGLSQFVNGHHHDFHVRLRARLATIRIGDRVQTSQKFKPSSALNLTPASAQRHKMRSNNFQINHDLVPDGVVGPKTWAALGIL